MRNPSNNLRFIKALTCQLDPNKIKFKHTYPKTFDGERIVGFYKDDIVFEGTHMKYAYLLDDDRVRFISLVWQGIFSNFRIHFKMYTPDFEFKWILKYIPIPISVNISPKIWRFWVGWKIYPHDKLGISANNYRKFGAGFATQFKRIYPRNK